MLSSNLLSLFLTLSLYPTLSSCSRLFLIWFSHAASFFVFWSLVYFPSLCWSDSQITSAASRKQPLMPLSVAQAGWQRQPQGKLRFILVSLVRPEGHLLLCWVCAYTDRFQVRAVRSWDIVRMGSLKMTTEKSPHNFFRHGQDRLTFHLFVLIFAKVYEKAKPKVKPQDASLHYRQMSCTGNTWT